MSNKKNVLVILILIIVLGAFLRFYNIPKFSLWADEAYVVRFVQNNSLKDIVTGKEFDPGNPPFYYILFGLWTNIFGYGKLAVRFLPAIFGILSIPLVFVVGKKLLNTESGLIAALILSASPFHIDHSQSTRGYPERVEKSYPATN